MNNHEYYKDNKNKVYCIDTNIENHKEFISHSWIKITEDEAIAISNPPLTQQELDRQKEVFNITFLASETERIEAEIKIYERMRERNRADVDDLAMLEALEDYSIDLKKVTKQQGWPLEVDWPIAPEF